MGGGRGVAEQDTIKTFLELDSVMVVQLCDTKTTEFHTLRVDFMVHEFISILKRRKKERCKDSL